MASSSCSPAGLRYSRNLNGSLPLKSWFYYCPHFRISIKNLVGPFYYCPPFPHQSDSFIKFMTFTVKIIAHFSSIISLRFEIALKIHYRRVKSWGKYRIKIVTFLSLRLRASRKLQKGFWNHTVQSIPLFCDLRSSSTKCFWISLCDQSHQQASPTDPPGTNP